MKWFILVALNTALATQQPTNELNLDFRNGQFRETVVSYFGPGAKKYVKPHAEGLRITIPETEKALQKVGIASKLALHGDFEITCSYTMLDVRKPRTGSGAGVNLSIHAASPNEDSAIVGRRVHPTKGGVYATNRGVKNTDGNTKYTLKTVSTQAVSGKLRLTRNGTTLIFLAAEAGKDSFQELRREDFVDQPINVLRVTADTGDNTSTLDVRVESLQIQGKELRSDGVKNAGKPTAATGNDTNASSLGGWLWVVIVLIGVLLVAGGVFLARKFWKSET